VAKLTLEQKKQIDKLTSDSKTCGEIKIITGIDYKTLYSYINRFTLAETARGQYIANPRVKKMKAIKNSVPSNFVDTGREIPPTHVSEYLLLATLNDDILYH